MNWKGKIAAFYKQVGPACKFVAKVAMGTIAPGSPVVIELVERALDCAQESADKVWEVERDRKSLDDLERMGTLLEEMQTQWGPVLKEMAKLQGMPEAARKILDTALNTNSQVCEAGERLKTLVAKFDRLENVAMATHGEVVGMREEMNAKLAAIVQRFGAEHEARQRRGKETQTVAAEQQSLRAAWAIFSDIPAQNLDAGNLLQLGEMLERVNLFAEADACDSKAAAAAEKQDHKQAALAYFKSYRDCCQTSQWDKALRSLQLTVQLDADSFEPFDMHRYRVQRILGAGSFGTVFLCEDQIRKRPVAVKALHNANCLDRSAQQILEEANILFSLHEQDRPSPGRSAIIKVYHCDFFKRPDQRPFIVMEYFPGISLREYLRQHSTLPAADLVAIARRVAEAMHEAHRLNVLHRDLKPDNILVRQTDNGWEVKIVDFGLAASLRAVATGYSKQAALRSREEMAIVGSLDYAPPEQKGQASGIDIQFRSDVYAFGRTFCEALFKTPTPPSWYYSDSARVPKEYGDGLRELLERCAVDAVEDRWPDFDVVAQKLKALDPRRRQAEGLLRQRYLELLEQTGGKPTREAMAPLNKLCRDHDLDSESANAIVRRVKSNWDQQRRARLEKEAAEKAAADARRQAKEGERLRQEALRKAQQEAQQRAAAEQEEAEWRRREQEATQRKAELERKREQEEAQRQQQAALELKRREQAEAERQRIQQENAQKEAERERKRRDQKEAHNSFGQFDYNCPACGKERRGYKQNVGRTAECPHCKCSTVVGGDLSEAERQRIQQENVQKEAERERKRRDQKEAHNSFGQFDYNCPACGKGRRGYKQNVGRTAECPHCKCSTVVGGEPWSSDCQPPRSARVS